MPWLSRTERFISAWSVIAISGPGSAIGMDVEAITCHDRLAFGWIEAACVIGSCGLLHRLWTSTPATEARDQECREERHADDEASGEVGGREYYGADGDRRGS